MTGRIKYAPQAQQQLHALDDWITETASRDVAQRFVSTVLDCIDGILHGGQDWEAAFSDE